MEHINDPKNIAGLSNLIRDDNLDSAFDLAELEREIANGVSNTKSEEPNFADDYRKEIEQLSRNFDLESSVKQSHTNISPVSSPEQFNRSITNTVNSPVARRNDYNSPKASNSKVNWDTYETSDNQLKNMTIEESKQSKINQLFAFNFVL